MARLTVKATLDATTRRFPVDDGSTFAAFQTQLQTLFHTSESLSVTYRDVDDDVITVSSDIELAELFATTPDLSPRVARVFLGRSASAAAARAVALAPTRSDGTPRVDSLVSGVSHLLSDPVAADMDVDTPAAEGLPAAAKGSRKRLLSGLFPYVAAFPSGKSGFRKSVKAVSPEVKIAFKKLVRFIVNAENTGEIVAALRDSYPILHSWMEQELGDEALPSADTVEALVQEAEATLPPRIGEQPTSRIVAFVRLGLADAGFVNLLREIHSAGPMPWEEGYEPKTKKAAKAAKAARRGGAKSAKDAATAAKGVDSSATAGETDAKRVPDAPKKGIFAGLKPYMSAFPSGRPGFRKSAKPVAPNVKAEFKGVVRFVSKSPDRAQIVSGLKDAFPTFRKWIDNDLGDEGVPATEGVNALVETLKEELLPKAGEDATTKVCAFVANALADEAVLNILRKVRGMGTMPWEKGFRMPVIKDKKAPRGFNVHINTGCSNCKTKPIVGMRYKCMNRPDFNLCSECFNNPEVNTDGLEFKECRFVWESVLADTSVPPAPLKPGDRGPKVKFLHKVLTDRGYMNEGMYAKRIGFYGPNTKAAVQQFQREQVMNDIVEDGVYDEPTAKRLEDVLEGRTTPAAKPDEVGEPALVQV